MIQRIKEHGLGFVIIRQAALAWMHNNPAPLGKIDIVPMILTLRMRTNDYVGLSQAGVSRLSQRPRDVWYIMRYLMGPLVLITPVYYPRTALPEPWKEYMLFNPLTPILELYRWALFHSEPMRWDALALSGAVILVMLLLGLLFFIKWEPKVLDRA